MRKAWRVVLIIVFIVILLGAVAIAAGFLTGADADLIYSVMEKSPAVTFFQAMLDYMQQAVDALQQWAQPLLQQFAAAPAPAA